MLCLRATSANAVNISFPLIGGLVICTPGSCRLPMGGKSPPNLSTAGEADTRCRRREKIISFRSPGKNMSSGDRFPLKPHKGKISYCHSRVEVIQLKNTASEPLSPAQAAQAPRPGPQNSAAERGHPGQSLLFLVSLQVDGPSQV